MTGSFGNSMNEERSKERESKRGEMKYKYSGTRFRGGHPD